MRDVGMLQMGPGFDLPVKLVLYTFLLQLRLKRTLSAMMKRVKYTFPNLPLPKGCPISKLSIVKDPLNVPMLFWPGAAVGWAFKWLFRTSEDGVVGSLGLGYSCQISWLLGGRAKGRRSPSGSSLERKGERPQRPVAQPSSWLLANNLECA